MLSHPVSVLIVFAICSGALGWQARHFEIDASADTLLTRGNQLYIQTQIMNQRFAPQEFLLIAYKPKDHPVLSQQTFSKLASLSQKLRELERVQSVRSLLNVPMLTLMDDPLTGGNNPSEWTLQNKGFSVEQLEDAFEGHPIYEDLLINKPQTATAVQVLFAENPKLVEIQNDITEIQKNALHRDLTNEEQQRVEELELTAEPIEKQLAKVRIKEIETIRAMLREYEQDAEIYLGGGHVLVYQLIQIVKKDLMVFGGIIATVICLVLFILFGKLRWVFIPIITCACSVILTLGLFGMLGLKTTVISSNFIALQLILTLAIVIHLIVQYREYGVQHPEWDQKQLVRETFLEKVKPCFYAGLTTSVGFASLLFTGIQPVISFGWMMIIAMCFSILVSLILCPALMVLLTRDKPKGQHRLSNQVLKFFTHVDRHHAGSIILASCGALALGIGGLFLLNVENSFINYFGKNTRVHQELSFIDQELGGSTPLDVIITVPESQRHKELVVSAKTVQQLQQIQKLLEQQKGMGKTLSIVNFTELAKEINDGKPLTEYELTGIYRTLSDDLRDDLVGSFFSQEDSQIRISARVKDATEGLNRAELLSDIHLGMKQLGISEDDYILTNLFVLYQDILERLFRSQILSLGLVYLVLTATFCLVFRSLKLGLIGIAPNILSTISVLGFMGLAGIPLDLMTITIASIAMGIAVDDTIHYIHRYQGIVRKEQGKEALKRTNFSVGYAVLYTSIIIIMGFSLLAFSDFVPSVQFGLLCSLAMIMATAWNLSLLPVLLNKYIKPPTPFPMNP